MVSLIPLSWSNKRKNVQWIFFVSEKGIWKKNLLRQKCHAFAAQMIAPMEARMDWDALENCSPAPSHEWKPTAEKPCRQRMTWRLRQTLVSRPLWEMHLKREWICECGIFYREIYGLIRNNIASECGKRSAQGQKNPFILRRWDWFIVNCGPKV